AGRGYGRQDPPGRYNSTARNNRDGRDRRPERFVDRVGDSEYEINLRKVKEDRRAIMKAITVNDKKAASNGWVIEQQGAATHICQVTVDGEGILLSPCFIVRPTYDNRESLETGRAYVRRLYTSELKWYGIDNDDWKRPREIKAKVRLKQL